MILDHRADDERDLSLLQDGAKAYMRNHNVPNVMQRRVQRWYDYAWSRSVTSYCATLCYITNSKYVLEAKKNLSNTAIE